MQSQFPARGRKHEELCRKAGDKDDAKPIPRKGTETSKNAPAIASPKMMQSQFPARGRKLESSRAFRALFSGCKANSPQGDGNKEEARQQRIRQ